MLHFHASLLIARDVSIYTDIFFVRIIYRATNAFYFAQSPLYFSVTNQLTENEMQNLQFHALTYGDKCHISQ